MTGAAAGNYTLAATSLSGAIGTITRRTLTATLTGTASKVYDGTKHRQPRRVELRLLLFRRRDRALEDVTLVSPSSGTYASANAGTGIGISATASR